MRKDFPQLNQTVYDAKPLVYLDSAATAQKPQCVIDEITNYYTKYCGSVNRSAHYLSEQATLKYEAARKKVANFIGAKNPSQVIFTRSATEGINLVAHGLQKIHFKPGDEIILTAMEHHSNIVPWYLAAKNNGLIIKVAPIFDDGTLDIEAFSKLFNRKTKLASFVHVSNALGSINPIAQMIDIAKTNGVPTLIDAAQSTAHLPIDVSKLDCDFLVFSGHKVYGPSGIGVLYAKEDFLEKMPPYQSGGDMIASVSFDDISFASAPQKFEAGTPNIAGALGLARALEYLSQFKDHELYEHEMSLYKYAMNKLSDIKEVKIIGTAKDKVSIISFVVEGIHPHDISSIFDREGVAIRAGHLCTQPLMKRFNVSALARASIAFYNTFEDIDRFVAAFDRLFEVFKKRS